MIEKIPENSHRQTEVGEISRRNSSVLPLVVAPGPSQIYLPQLALTVMMKTHPYTWQTRQVIYSICCDLLAIMPKEPSQ
jgi:hypothetical protein